MNCEGPDLHELIPLLYAAELASPLIIFGFFFATLVILPGGVGLLVWHRLHDGDQAQVVLWPRRLGWCCIGLGLSVFALFMLIGLAGMFTDDGECFPRYENCDD